MIINVEISEMNHDLDLSSHWQTEYSLSALLVSIAGCGISSHFTQLDRGVIFLFQLRRLKNRHQWISSYSSFVDLFLSKSICLMSIRQTAKPDSSGQEGRSSPKPCE